MASKCFIGICIWAALSVAGLIIFSVLYSVANPDAYMRLCTVTRDYRDRCVLVSPIEGNITLPYQWESEPQYEGEVMPCKYLDTLLTCYTYDYDKRASEDDPPDIAIAVTASRSKAIAHHFVTYAIFIGVFGLSTLLVSLVFFWIACQMGQRMARYGLCGMQQVYDEL